MSCCCNQINYKSTAIAVADGNMNISVNSTNVPNNLECATLVICQTIPTQATPIPVQITIGATNYPVFTKAGNKLMSDQIRTRRRYFMVFGNNPNHFSVMNCETLCHTSFVPTPAVVISDID